jgi:hypothetical protein
MEVVRKSLLRRRRNGSFTLKTKLKDFVSMKLFRHHAFGANKRTYQMHTEFKDFGTWDRFLVFHDKDAKAAEAYKNYKKSGKKN